MNFIKKQKLSHVLRSDEVLTRSCKHRTGCVMSAQRHCNLSDTRPNAIFVEEPSSLHVELEKDLNSFTIVQLNWLSLGPNPSVCAYDLNPHSYTQHRRFPFVFLVYRRLSGAIHHTNSIVAGRARLHQVVTDSLTSCFFLWFSIFPLSFSPSLGLLLCAHPRTPSRALSALCLEKKTKQAKQRKRKKRESRSCSLTSFYRNQSYFFFGLPFLFSSPLSLAFCCSMLPFHPIPMLDRAPAEHERSPRECVHSRQATLARASWGLCVSVCCLLFLSCFSSP